MYRKTIHGVCLLLFAHHPDSHLKLDVLHADGAQDSSRASGDGARDRQGGQSASS